ncbi:hypothetical protein ACO3VM_00465 [Methanocaldococcus sp. 10A]
MYERQGDIKKAIEYYNKAIENIHKNHEG